MPEENDVKASIIESLEPLFKEAAENGKWFYSPYQGMWFSPQELRKEHSSGRLCWGPSNWMLRDPGEMIAGIADEIKRLNTRLTEALERVRRG